MKWQVFDLCCLILLHKVFRHPPCCCNYQLNAQAAKCLTGIYWLLSVQFSPGSGVYALKTSPRRPVRRPSSLSPANILTSSIMFTQNIYQFTYFVLITECIVSIFTHSFSTHDHTIISFFSLLFVIVNQTLSVWGRCNRARYILDKLTYIHTLTFTPTGNLEPPVNPVRYGHKREVHTDSSLKLLTTASPCHSAVCGLIEE